MEDIPEFMRYLKNWKSDADSRKIEDILLRISKYEASQEEENDLNKLVDILTEFHK